MAREQSSDLHTLATLCLYPPIPNPGGGAYCFGVDPIGVSASVCVTLFQCVIF